MKRRKSTDENTNSDNDTGTGEDGQPRAKRPNTTPRSPLKSSFIGSPARSPARSGGRGTVMTPFGPTPTATPSPPVVSPVRRSPKNAVLYLPVIGKENEKTEALDDATVVFREMPSRPLNPFFLYMAERMGKVLSESKTRTLSAFSASPVIAKEWEEMSIQKKRKWYIEAQKEKDRHFKQVKQKLFDFEIVEDLDVHNNDKENDKGDKENDDKNEKNDNKNGNGVKEADNDNSNNDKSIKNAGKSSSIRFDPSVTFI